MKLFCLAAILFLLPAQRSGFCPVRGESELRRLPQNDVAEARILPEGGVDRIIKVERSEVPGFWA